MARIESSSAGEDNIERAVASKTKELFEKAEWVVEEEPLVGTTRPDLVLRSPEGATYVVELKVGRGSAHFGSLAQVATFKEEYEDARAVKGVKGMLVTNMTAQESLVKAAKSLDIEVVAVGGGPGEMAEKVFKSIYGMKGKG